MVALPLRASIARRLVGGVCWAALLLFIPPLPWLRTTTSGVVSSRWLHVFSGWLPIPTKYKTLTRQKRMIERCFSLVHVGSVTAIFTLLLGRRVAFLHRTATCQPLFKPWVSLLSTYRTKRFVSNFYRTFKVFISLSLVYWDARSAKYQKNGRHLCRLCDFHVFIEEWSGHFLCFGKVRFCCYTFQAHSSYVRNLSSFLVPNQTIFN